MTLFQQKTVFRGENNNFLFSKEYLYCKNEVNRKVGVSFKILKIVSRIHVFAHFTSYTTTPLFCSIECSGMW